MHCTGDGRVLSHTNQGLGGCSRTKTQIPQHGPREMSTRLPTDVQRALEHSPEDLPGG